MRLLGPVSLLLFSLPALGSIVFDNGAPDLENGHQSDADYPALTGNLFSLTGVSTLRDVHWWGVYARSDTPGTDEFTIDFYNAPGGVPSLTRIASYPVSTTRSFDGTQLRLSGYDVYRYSAVIPDTPLGPGSYLISIVNNTGSDSDDDWYWATSQSPGIDGFIRSDFESAWHPTSYDNAFYLTDDGSAVPESGTALLVAISLVAIAICLYRRDVSVSLKTSR